MGKTYYAGRYIIKFLKKEHETKNEIVTFYTEKNLLVDRSFLKIIKQLKEREKGNLLF